MVLCRCPGCSRAGEGKEQGSLCTPHPTQAIAEHWPGKPEPMHGNSLAGKQKELGIQEKHGFQD